MLIITDPTFLLTGNLDTATSPGAELTIDTSALTIKINPGQGDLDATVGGVTGQALFSALKILWLNSTTYPKYGFPMNSITPEQYEFINGWKPADDITRKAIRTAGWVEYSSTMQKNRTYAGIISLGSMGGTDQPYFQQVSNGSATNFSFTGAVNEAVQIYGTTANGDASAGSFDYSSYMKLFVREYQKAYSAAQLSDIGVTTMTSIVYRFPLANSTDLKVTHADATVSNAGGAYNPVNITYFGSDQSKSIGASSYPFRVVIEGASLTAEQIYEKVQYLLRQNSDVDTGAGTVTGKTADSLLKFVGDTLVTSSGVFINNFNANDTNRIDFYDYNGVKRNFPYVSSGNLTFGSNATSDYNSKYWLFFAAGFGSANATIVKDSSNNDITGIVAAQYTKTATGTSGQFTIVVSADNTNIIVGQYVTGTGIGTSARVASIAGTTITLDVANGGAVSGTITFTTKNSVVPFSFAYDSNIQGTPPRTAGQDANVILVVSGLSACQYTSATATITKATGQTISVSPGQERNYSN